MAELSSSLQKKVDFYLRGSPFSSLPLEGTAKVKALEYLQTKALAKVKGVTAAVNEDIRRALITAQATNQPVVAAASSILGQSRLEKGAFSSSRKRATAIARNELRAARNEGMMAEGEERGIVMFTWISVMSKGSCPVCIGRHGQTHSIAVWRRMGLPPSPHPNCACGLVPGRGIPVPKAMTRTAIRKLGVAGRVFRQVKETDYLKMRKSFVRCTDRALGL